MVEAIDIAETAALPRFVNHVVLPDSLEVKILNPLGISTLPGE